MTTPNHRTATAALDAARPLITRLDAGRHPDEVAADLIEAWGAVETALRALLGGSALTGQGLIGEVRQRGLLDYRHAHDLLGFLAARDRASRAGHRPDASDVDAARTGFQSLEAALGMGIGAPTGVHRAVGPLPPPPPPSATGTRAAPPPPATARPALASAPVEALPRRRRAPSRSVLVVALVALAAVAAGAFWWTARGTDTPGGLQRGVVAYQAGQKEVARREFQAVAEERPDLALPRVWLARLAREDGDFPRATTELERAIRAEPSSAVAQREMGQLQLQLNNPPLAQRFLARAVEADTADRVAQGWLACALARQRQVELARRFADRAGQGDWSGCVNALPAAPIPAGAYPPGAYPPGALPPGAVPPPAVPRP
jgi:tetratricopeptide (TPR) repeat protein